MLRLTTLYCLLAALLSATQVLADTLPQVTPAPSLEKRQNLGVAANPELAASQVPPVTVYEIMNAKGVEDTYTYTQKFSKVPDQWPSPKSGEIGYGSLQKRDVLPAPTPTANTEVQPIVLVMETEIVTRPMQRVTRALVLQTLDIISYGPAANETTTTSPQVSISTTISATSAQRFLSTASA